MRRAEQVIKSVRALRGYPPVMLLANAYLELEPDDEQGQLFRAALGWAVGNLMDQNMLLAAYAAVPQPRRYAEKVRALVAEVDTRIDAEVGCDQCTRPDCSHAPTASGTTDSKRPRRASGSCPHARGPTADQARDATVIPFPTAPTVRDR